MKQTVEIVGAGIAGLTTGLAFAQKGWQVRVHEQRSALCNRREGIFVWENGLRVLDALGVLTPTIAGAGRSPKAACTLPMVTRCTPTSSLPAMARTLRSATASDY
jgi:2-polyprenyl-6-methoxyphenol hydroxylase-like FAD-dependent oxidoreductase